VAVQVFTDCYEAAGQRPSPTGALDLPGASTKAHRLVLGHRAPLLHGKDLVQIRGRAVDKRVSALGGRGAEFPVHLSDVVLQRPIGLPHPGDPGEEAQLLRQSPLPAARSVS